MSLHSLSRDLKIPTPLACNLCKHNKLNILLNEENLIESVKNHIRSIPTLSHYSWSKESQSLHKELTKKNIKKKKILWMK